MQDLARLLVIAMLASACGAGATQPSIPPTPADNPGKAKALASAAPGSASAAPSSSAPSSSTPEVASSLAIPVRVKVSASKTEMSSVEAKDLMLTFDVTNTGSRPVHTELEKSVLLVNGKPHNGFKETLEDIKDDKWDSLGPGETARFHYKFVSRGTVKPGEYSFVLQVGATFSEPLVLRVTP